jgi:hypothetical protein
MTRSLRAKNTRAVANRDERSLGRRFTLEVRHHQRRYAIVFTDIVDGADVRVIDLTKESALRGEPCAELRIGYELRAENLDGYPPMQTGVAVLVYLPRPPAPIRPRFHRRPRGRRDSSPSVLNSRTARTRQHLVQACTRREDVGAVIRGQAASLVRR